MPPPALNGKPALALAISCVGRRLVLGARTEEETEAALEALPPGSRQIGFYSYGEISPAGRACCELHNQTMTLTTIREINCITSFVASCAGFGSRRDACPPPMRGAPLLDHVSQSYGNADQDRYLLERSQDISSREMQELNDALQHERDTLGIARARSHGGARRERSRASGASPRSAPTGIGSRTPSSASRRSAATSPKSRASRSTSTSAARTGRSRASRPPDGGWFAPPRAARLARDVLRRRPATDSSGARRHLRGDQRRAGVRRRRGASSATAASGARSPSRSSPRRTSTGSPTTTRSRRSSIARAFFERLAHALSVARRHGNMLAVLFIDLDRFKDVNDVFGHLTGDEVLKIMAQRISDTIRASDTAARLGGDEFIVLAENVATRMATSAISRSACSTCCPSRSRYWARNAGFPRASALRCARTTATTARRCSRRPTSRCTARRTPAATASRSSPRSTAGRPRSGS